MWFMKVAAAMVLLVMALASVVVAQTATESQR